MSFILDALKKSDRQRKRGEVPGLQTMHAPLQSQARRRPIWPFLLLALLLNAGLLLWWLAPWQDRTVAVPASGSAVPHRAAAAPRPAAPPRPSVPPVSAPSPVASAPPAATGAAAEVAEEPLVSNKADLAQPVVSQPQPAAPAHELARESTARRLEKRVPSPGVAARETSTSVPRQARPSPVVAEPPVYEQQELPAGIRDGVPEMAISVHFYSSRPASRMVRINGNILREGDALASGLILEEITPEGGIFSYRGYRFRVVRPAPGDRLE